MRKGILRDNGLLKQINGLNPTMPKTAAGDDDDTDDDDNDDGDNDDHDEVNYLFVSGLHKKRCRMAVSQQLAAAVHMTRPVIT